MFKFQWIHNKFLENTNKRSFATVALLCSMLYRPAAAVLTAAAADYDYCCYYYLMFECITYQLLAAVRELIAFMWRMFCEKCIMIH